MRTACTSTSGTAAAACLRSKSNGCLNRLHQLPAEQVWECRLFIKLFATIVVQSTFVAAKEKEQRLVTRFRALKSEFRRQESEVSKKPLHPQRRLIMTRTPAKNFQDLVVWQKSHEFVLSVYQSTRAFPREEVYGLTSQFRRAAIS